jgi:hypothetical protein
MRPCVVKSGLAHTWASLDSVFQLPMGGFSGPSSMNAKPVAQHAVNPYAMFVLLA